MRSAADRLAEVRRNTSDAVLRLAYHAALPVVIDGGLLNLLRVNFFLDPPDVLPFEAEAALLLSSLFREIGNDLYEIEPEVRNILLIGLQAQYDAKRVRQVALLLEQYTYTSLVWSAQPELEQAQLLTALSFVDPERARTWLEAGRQGGVAEIPGRAWFVAMRGRLAAQPRAHSILDAVVRAAGFLSEGNAETRLDAVRTLAALAQLPGTDVAPIARALNNFIRLSRDSGTLAAEDARTALSVLRGLGTDYRVLADLLTEQARQPASVVTADRPSNAPVADDDILPRGAPIFFLSYANQLSKGSRQVSGRDQRSPVSQFFDDLSENVAELISRPVGSDPGFFDRSIAAGKDWTSELLSALGTCQVFVPLISPQYLNSSWCGMEWYAFTQRKIVPLDEASYHSTILPVIWTPVRHERIPRVVAEVQMFRPGGLPDLDITQRYLSEGIYGLLRLRDDDAYQVVVWKLAQAIADSYYRRRVQSRITRPSELHDVFQES